MLTTNAITGLRMKRSVKLLDNMAEGPQESSSARSGRSGIRRRRGRTRDWLAGVVDLNRKSVTQLEHARSDNLFSGFEAVRDRDKVSSRGAQFDELLPNSEELLAVVVP